MIRIDAEKCVRCHACIRDCVVAILQPGADGVPVLAPELEPWGQKTCYIADPEGNLI